MAVAQTPSDPRQTAPADPRRAAPADPRQAAPASPNARPRFPVSDPKAVWVVWCKRRHYRRELRRLLRAGPHLIADIGLTLEAARREAGKPFWRA